VAFDALDLKFKGTDPGAACTRPRVRGRKLVRGGAASQMLRAHHNSEGHPRGTRAQVSDSMV